MRPALLCGSVLNSQESVTEGAGSRNTRAPVCKSGFSGGIGSEICTSGKASE